MKDYVEKHGPGYRITGSRVSLDSVVYCFKEGQSPESIVQAFPTLRLEQVYGAITYYLAHRSEVDQYLDEARKDFEAAREKERGADAAFYERLSKARQQRVTAV